MGLSPQPFLTMHVTSLQSRDSIVQSCDSRSEEFEPTKYGVVMDEEEEEEEEEEREGVSVEGEGVRREEVCGEDVDVAKENSFSSVKQTNKQTNITLQYVHVAYNIISYNLMTSLTFISVVLCT